MNTAAFWILQFTGLSAELFAIADRITKEAEALEAASSVLRQQAEALRTLAVQKAGEKMDTDDDLVRTLINRGKEKRAREFFEPNNEFNKFPQDIPRIELFNDEWLYRSHSFNILKDW